MGHLRLTFKDEAPYSQFPPKISFGAYDLAPKRVPPCQAPAAPIGRLTPRSERSGQGLQLLVLVRAARLDDWNGEGRRARNNRRTGKCAPITLAAFREPERRVTSGDHCTARFAHSHHGLRIGNGK
jgi:hypothetical protein